MADLQEAVAFDKPLSIADGQGGEENGWQEVHACRAHFRYLRGGEAVQAGRLAGRQAVVVTVASTTVTRAITSDYRMRDTRRADIYNIRSIVETDDRVFLELTCERGVSV